MNIPPILEILGIATHVCIPSQLLSIIRVNTQRRMAFAIIFFMRSLYMAFRANKINQFMDELQDKNICKYLPIKQDPITLEYVYPRDIANRNISQASAEDTIVFHKFLERKGRSMFFKGPNFDNIVKFGNVNLIRMKAHKFVKDYVDYKILKWLSKTFCIHVPTNPCLRLIFGDSHVLSEYNVNEDYQEVQIPRYLPLRKDPINEDYQEVQNPRYLPLRKDPINKDHQEVQILRPRDPC